MALPPCKCRRVIAVLTRLGATHAARMHDASSRGEVIEWSPEDWKLHFSEERRLLFPMMRKRLPRMIPLIAALEQEHGMFLGELKLYGRIMSEKRMERHAEIEDQLVLALEDAA